jgi:hypothetical protein
VISLPSSGRSTLTFSVTCYAACTVGAKLTVDRTSARRLGLGRSLVAGSLTKKTTRTRRTTYTLKLKRTAGRALLRGKRTYRARLRVTATYGSSKSAAATKSRQVRLKPRA